MRLENLFPVDRCYVISLTALERLLKKISVGDDSYWVHVANSRWVAITFSNSQGRLPIKPDAPIDPYANSNSITFTFPIIAWLVPFVDDGIMICLYDMAAKEIQKAIYPDRNLLKGDLVEDWNRFWTPLEAAVKEYYEEWAVSGASGVSESAQESPQTEHSSSEFKRRRI